MNRIYRLVFNASHGLVQVCSELGSSRGKDTLRTAGKSVPAKTRIALALALTLGTTLPLLSVAPAQAAMFVSSFTAANGGSGSGGNDVTQGIGGAGTGSGSHVNGGGNGGTAVPGYTSGYAGSAGGAGYGAGGRGGNSYYYIAVSTYYYGGGGGGGGAPGARLGGAYAIYGGTTIRGGAGGDGGYSYGYSGFGGGGGDGIFGTNFALDNAGTISGGAGGIGGVGGAASPWYGKGGAGGAGVSGSGFTLINTGSIAGGGGGDSAAYDGGSGGAGVVSTGGSTITNSGVITGGVGGYASGFLSNVQADAVDFTGGGNTLALLYTTATNNGLTGNVVSTSGTTGGGDTLELGGNTDAALSGAVVSTAPTSYSTAPQFYGFQTLLKSGTSSWSVTNVTGGTPNVIPNWDVEDGILQIAGGDNFNPAATDTLTVAIKPTGVVSTTPGIDNGELSVSGRATLRNESLTVNLAKGKYIDGVTYTLVSATKGINCGFGSVTYNPSLPSTTTPNITCGANTVTLSFTGGFKIGGGGGGGFGLFSLAGLLGVAAAGRGARRNRLRSN
jgi:hypothetical protein